MTTHILIIVEDNRIPEDHPERQVAARYEIEPGGRVPKAILTDLGQLLHRINRRHDHPEPSNGDTGT